MFVIEKDELLPSQYLREKHAANSPLACTARTFRSQSADWLVVRALSSLAGAVLHDHDPQSALKKIPIRASLMLRLAKLDVIVGGHCLNRGEYGVRLNKSSG